MFRFRKRAKKNPEGKIKNQKKPKKFNSELAALTEGTPKLPFSYENL